MTTFLLSSELLIVKIAFSSRKSILFWNEKERLKSAISAS